MTPEDIDKLTIAEVRAIAERAGDALKTLQQLGLMGPPPIQARAFSPDGLRAPTLAPIGADANLFKAVPIHTPLGPLAPASPFPCLTCGRAATEKPGEPVSPIECQLCGNHLPLPAGAAGPRVSNKGPLVMDADMQARRAALISAPAFDEHGEPT